MQGGKGGNHEQNYDWIFAQMKKWKQRALQSENITRRLYKMYEESETPESFYKNNNN